MSDLTAFSKFWREVNRTLWRCAVDKVEPRDFVRIDMWNRVENVQRLEKSALYRVSKPKIAESAIYRACRWIVAQGKRTPAGASTFFDVEDVSAPENAAIPEHWPKFYPGVDTSLGKDPSLVRRNDVDNYQVFVNGFFYAFTNPIKKSCDYLFYTIYN